MKALGWRDRSSGAGASGPMTEEEKAERKTLIANNKAWASAEIVRREWLAEFLSRKTMPKDAQQWVAVALTRHRQPIGHALGESNSLASTLLGVDASPSYWKPTAIEEYAAAHPARRCTSPSRSPSAASRPAPARAPGVAPASVTGSTSSRWPHGATACPRSSRSSSTEARPKPPKNAPRAENIRGTATDDTAAQAGAEFDPFHAESDDYDETVTDES